MDDKRRLSHHPDEHRTDPIEGLTNDRYYQGVDEFTYPDYPDLPYPDSLERWDYNGDPLIQNDEPAPRQEAWDPEDPHAPWREPYIPQHN